MKTKAAIILDRDGVINADSDSYVKSLDEFNLIPGSVKAIADLYQAGWPVFVVTNQSGLERGLFDVKTLADMHRFLYKKVMLNGGEIEAIYYCPHHPDTKCECRKPKPGLFQQLALEHQVDLARSYYVGDKITDVEVALTVGATPVLVKTGKGQQTFRDPIIKEHGIPVHSDLFDFVHNFLSVDDPDE